MTSRLQTAFEKVKQELLNRRTSDGHWVGRLSSSALSTATAITALTLAQRSGCDFRYDLSRSADYLLAAQNPDGGWGDTDKSFSNISTTLLAQAALTLFHPDVCRGALEKARQYIETQGGNDAIRKRYGKDQTFSVPILTNAALAGLADWSDVPQLPFERAAMPQWMFRLLNLQVVSYAIPALVAIGQVRLHHTERVTPMTLLRHRAIKPTLALLERMQPNSGGYLEAAPLTSFVAMSLLDCGLPEHPVVRNCLRFLLDTVRSDGSWAIDTNLSTWTTTLSVNALGKESFNVKESEQLVDGILSFQHTKKHPFTGALPGGWGWTDLSGAVPDADDTAGAVLALKELQPNIEDEPRRKRINDAVRAGIIWLQKLRNRDGGIPTFCRGWGMLPFDKSSTDLTAHTIRALYAGQSPREPAAMPLVRFLKQSQQKDGSWIPLWFGNQEQPEDINPFYGTAKVLLALIQLENSYVPHQSVQRGFEFLLTNQNADGSWGNSIEETAAAVEALAASEHSLDLPALQKGRDYLLNAVESGSYCESSPIGLYFAKLWYYEELYPLIFTAAALRRCLKKMENCS